MTDWKTRGGQVNAGMKLDPLDLNKEHVFELVSVEIKEGVPTKFGIKNKVNLVWKESGKEKDFHRVWTNFNESYAEKSNLVAFLRKVSPKPILPGANVFLGDFLEVGMKIKAMLQNRMDTTTGMPSGYYDFVPASIKPASQQGANNAPPTLTEALFIAHGCANGMDALSRLSDAGVKPELIALFLSEDKKGNVKYPVGTK